MSFDKQTAFQEEFLIIKYALFYYFCLSSKKLKFRFVMNGSSTSRHFLQSDRIQSGIWILEDMIKATRKRKNIKTKTTVVK